MKLSEDYQYVLIGKGGKCHIVETLVFVWGRTICGIGGDFKRANSEDIKDEMICKRCKRAYQVIVRPYTNRNPRKHTKPLLKGHDVLSVFQCSECNRTYETWLPKCVMEIRVDCPDCGWDTIHRRDKIDEIKEGEESYLIVKKIKKGKLHVISEGPIEG